MRGNCQTNQKNRESRNFELDFLEPSFGPWLPELSRKEVNRVAKDTSLVVGSFCWTSQEKGIKINKRLLCRITMQDPTPDRTGTFCSSTWKQYSLRWCTPCATGVHVRYVVLECMHAKISCWRINLGMMTKGNYGRKG